MSSQESLNDGHWQIDQERLEEFGVRPGVYQHFKGGEYLTLTAGWRMSQNGADETVGEKVVIYVALYNHPEYGPNAVWDRSVQGFLEDVEVEGQTESRFRFMRDEL